MIQGKQFILRMMQTNSFLFDWFNLLKIFVIVDVAVAGLDKISNCNLEHKQSPVAMHE